MEFQGRYSIPASPDTVWAALNDVDILKYCIPGCESLVKTSPNAFEAVATVKIGPMRAAFRSKISLSELNPPKSCRLTGEGQGGAAGFAKGEADVRLEPDGLGTRLDYSARATIGGKLAQIGQRLIDSAARQIADDFFSRFSGALSAAQTATLEPDPALEPQSAPSQDPRRATLRERRAPEIWALGLIGIVVVAALIIWSQM